MKVKFVPQNVEFEIKPGESVMHLAEDNGIYVKSVCRGVPSCAECRVKIVEGETNVFAPVAAELGLIGSGWFIDRRRLSCQLQCIGNVTIDMSEQIAKQQGLIGGRKAKAAKALGDRVEEETVIRDTSASGGRRDREDEDEDDEKPDSNRGDRSRGGDRNRDRGRRDQRPQGNQVVIGAPKPNVEPSIAPTGPNASGGRIEPRPANAPQSANEGQSAGPRPQPGGQPGGSEGRDREGGGRDGGGRRSRRGGRGRR